LLPDDANVLDRGVRHFTAVLTEAVTTEFGVEAGDQVHQSTTAPGSGAAGGAGFAAMAMMGARRRRGVDVVVDVTNFWAALDGISRVIAGVGSRDAQTLSGKAPVGIAQAAAQRSIPVIAVCGRCQLS